MYPSAIVLTFETTTQQCSMRAAPAFIYQTVDGLG